MCELLGLSADHSVSFTCSLGRFAAHGSAAGRNHDGWGVAAFEDRDIRIIKEPTAAADSEWVRFIEAHGVDSALVIAHIRHASFGARNYRNTHPFCRELGGRMHVFAHNGTLEGLRRRQLHARSHHPIGETDSEYAFCLLLARLEALWEGGDPDAQARCEVVAAFAAEIAALGPANFLYADGELLFAHGHRRLQADGREAPPGLHLIQRQDIPTGTSWLASGVDLGEGAEPVAIVASVPLNHEPWHPLGEGELVVLSRGQILTTVRTG